MFIKDKVLFNFNLHLENVVFGYFNYGNNEVFVILFILLVKFHIHKCKFSNKNPVLQCFIKSWKITCVLFNIVLIERQLKQSVCVLYLKLFEYCKGHACL